MNIDNSDTDLKDLHDKRNKTLERLYYTESIMWSMYRIIYCIFLITLMLLFGVSVFLSLYNNSFVFTNLLTDIVNVVNILKLESIILILVLALIRVISTFITSYFKKD